MPLIYVTPRCPSTTSAKSSARFEALFSTRREPFRLLLPPSCSPAPTSLGQGLNGGLLEGSRDRSKIRSMPACRDAGQLDCFKTRNALFQRREHCMTKKPAYGTVFLYPATR